jgi:hypothetical protein
MKRNTITSVPIDSYRQGELDGLCGIYVIINAYRRLFGDKFSHERCTKIFMKLARAAPMAVFEGLSYRELLELIMLANANVPAAMRIEVRTQVFRKQVSSHAWGVETYIKRLREEVQEGKQVAIVGIQGAHDHWTLLHRVTPATFKLTDSSSLTNLRLANIGIAGKTKRSYRIVPSQTILLRPWKGSPNDLHPVRKRLAKLAIL